MHKINFDFPSGATLKIKVGDALGDVHNKVTLISTSIITLSKCVNT